MVASAALFLLLFELLVFPFVFVASDVPRNVWMGNMVRLHPGDQGVDSGFKRSSEIKKRTGSGCPCQVL
jgi:hypothetical protein